VQNFDSQKADSSLVTKTKRRQHHNNQFQVENYENWGKMKGKTELISSASNRPTEQYLTAKYDI
jgi:hypothetical protein